MTPSGPTPAPTAETSSSRYWTLDHWRGAAALWVVGFHATVLWAPAHDVPFGWIKSVLGLGWFGVHLFFVLSGYCLAERAARACIRGETTRGFLLDRACRILPTYWAALLLALALAALATPFNHRPLFSSPLEAGAIPGSLPEALIQFSLLGPWCDRPSYLLVGWTLTSELAFYALVGLGLASVRWWSSSLPAFALGYALALAIATGLIDPPTAVIDLWPEFMCGLLVWLALSRASRSDALVLVSIGGIVLLGVLGLACPIDPFTLPWAAGFSLLLIGLRRYDARILAVPLLRPLGFLGGISYSIYLIHVPFMSPLHNLLHRAVPEAPQQGWVPAVIVAVGLAAAWGFYRVAEQPLERWRRHRLRLALDSVAPTAPVA